MRKFNDFSENYPNKNNKFQYQLYCHAWFNNVPAGGIIFVLKLPIDIVKTWEK